jgi:signal peptide peptidase SppA
MTMPVTPKCFASHMGVWAIEPRFLQQAVSAIRSGLWQNAGNMPRSEGHFQPVSAVKVYDPDTLNSDYPDVMYSRTPEGVALFEFTGAMQKGRSKFGGVATVDQRKYLRAAVADPEVGAILLVIDSPGGTVSGTQSLADDIRAADARKPVLTHFEDLGASAAYWTGSQARRVSANRSAMIGSLGTFGVIEDSSGKAEAEGVKVHVLSTGPHKGAFVDGAPVTNEQLAEYQRIIDQLNAQFMLAVQGGRRMSEEQVSALFDGRVHLAADAKSLGLIDAIESLDGALAEATKLAQPTSGGDDRQRRIRMAKARE